MRLADLLTSEAVISFAEGEHEKAGAPGAERQGGESFPACPRARFSTRCCSASVSARPASATASPSRTASLRGQVDLRDFCAARAADRLRRARRRAGRSDLPADHARDVRAPIISRRSPARRGCFATPASLRPFAPTRDPAALYSIIAQTLEAPRRVRRRVSTTSSRRRRHRDDAAATLQRISARP